MAMISKIYRENSLATSNDIGWQTFLQVLGAAGLITLCSQIKITLPFTLVPFTCQTLAVMLIGSSLGSRKGAWALLLYFAEILMGLPVLAGGVSNSIVFIGPTGGYILGFCLQAYLMGWCVENMTGSKPVNLLIGGLLSCAVQMGLGVIVLAQFVGWHSVWALGLFPFIPGEILKVSFICFGYDLLKKRFI